MNFSVIINIGLGIGLGVITYFLQRLINDFDQCKRELEKIKSDYVQKSEIEKCKTDISNIKEDYITKEDFFREQGKTDKKLDEIIKMLFEMNKGVNK